MEIQTLLERVKELEEIPFSLRPRQEAYVKAYSKLSEPKATFRTSLVCLEDPVLTALVLRIANSFLINPLAEKNPVLSVEKAASLVGFERVLEELSKVEPIGFSEKFLSLLKDKAEVLAETLNAVTRPRTIDQSLTTANLVLLFDVWKEQFLSLEERRTLEKVKKENPPLFSKVRQKTLSNILKPILPKRARAEICLPSRIVGLVSHFVETANTQKLFSLLKESGRLTTKKAKELCLKAAKIEKDFQKLYGVNSQSLTVSFEKPEKERDFSKFLKAAASALVRGLSTKEAILSCLASEVSAEEVLVCPTKAALPEKENSLIFFAEKLKFQFVFKRRPRTFEVEKKTLIFIEKLLEALEVIDSSSLSFQRKNEKERRIRRITNG